MNSESVKPLLSAEDNKWKFGPSDREVAEWFSGNIDSECSASSAIFKFRLWLEEYASQLQPSSPQLEQEKWNAGFKAACKLIDDMYASSSTHPKMLGDCAMSKVGLLPSVHIRNNPLHKDEQEVKRLQEENENLIDQVKVLSAMKKGFEAAVTKLHARIKELEQQLSQSDAAGLLDDLISEALLCGYLNGRKQVEERVSVSGYGNRFREQVGIKKMTIKLLAAISPQSPTLEEGQNDPEQQ